LIDLDVNLAMRFSIRLSGLAPATTDPVVNEALTMCGRFTLTATPGALNQLFPSLFEGLEVAPSYNVASSQNVLAVRLHPGTKEPEAVQLRWGLVPSWADDPKIGYRTINARLDTAPTKPAFRSAFKHRHCQVLADAFYEWQKTGGKKKQPFHIRMRDGDPFALLACGRPGTAWASRSSRARSSPQSPTS
jgi:putative SOS response-associated peptidase YedK